MLDIRKDDMEFESLEFNSAENQYGRHTMEKPKKCTGMLQGILKHARAETVEVRYPFNILFLI